ncbi:MAG: peptide chain release factor 1 [Micavibrio sp.]|nr:peptide chain release factor 1 [Micavibrio sp.]
MSLVEKLSPIKSRFEELSVLMSGGNLKGDEFVKYSKEYADLEPVMKVINAYEKALSEQVDLEEMLNDPEMKAMAEDDLYRIKAELPELEKEIQLALIPKDSADDKSAILEIRAGTGGDEAALFAADLFSMYKNYASNNGWRLEVVEMAENDIGGYKEIIAEINGVGVYAKLKFESGAHRVQRVPETESGGRIHTSAATVAILPEAEDVDFEMRDDDLRIDVYRASGAGGQHVNKTESAVRVTHIPTGVSVAIQDGKSQHKNKAKALQILKSRLYEAERQRLHDERSADRKSLVGTGDRSDRIRTYNFPQGRVTDHRINLTLQKLDRILSGESLDEIIDALTAEDQANKLAEFNG